MALVSVSTKNMSLLVAALFYYSKLGYVAVTPFESFGFLNCRHTIIVGLPVILAYLLRGHIREAIF